DLRDEARQGPMVPILTSQRTPVTASNGILSGHVFRGRSNATARPCSDTGLEAGVLHVGRVGSARAAAQSGLETGRPLRADTCGDARAAGNAGVRALRAIAEAPAGLARALGAPDCGRGFGHPTGRVCDPSALGRRRSAAVLAPPPCRRFWIPGLRRPAG